MDTMDEKIKKRIATSFFKTIRSFGVMLPMLAGIILMLGLFKVYVTPDMIKSVFSGQPLQDALLGSVIGSISTGNPITSYIIGKGLVDDGISLFAVTSFIVAWVTVGMVQLPAEAALLGKKFALARNGLSFVLAILVALATVMTIGVIN